MATMAVEPWMADRDGHASDCISSAERSADIGAKLSALEAEERELLGELNSPGFRQRRHQAAGEAIADGLKPDDALPDLRGRLKAIAEEKPPLAAALTVLSERYSKSLQEAKGELARELRPEYVELLKPLAAAAVDMLAAADAERQFRDPLRMQGISFAGGMLQGLPYNPAGPDGGLVLWLRKLAESYPELKIRQQAAKKGITL